MKRWILGLGLGVALSFAVPFGMSVSDSEAKPKYRNKMCMYKGPISGKASNWKCKIDEVCCWSALENKGSCRPKGTICAL
ncbi:MAG TPA: hypothetical protein PK264_12000 [Hyphomicrobiaceae bacterium]|nr:hypothetical protein [Hyphomicrobiaceae bacterium]